MKTSFHHAATAALCLALAFLLWPSVEAGGQGEGKAPRVPDHAFLEIVQEANKFIQEPLAKFSPDSPLSDAVAGTTFRPNALLIALAAQNRMGKAESESGRLATLRDAALKLAGAVEKKPYNLAEVRKQAALLNLYPDLKADPHAKPGRVRLRDHFHHGDIGLLFGGCSGSRGHAIQLELFKLDKLKVPWSQGQAEKIELVAYKVALIGELLRDFDDDLIPATKPEQRKEWVSLAGDVQTMGWQLAETARGPNAADVQRVGRTLFRACMACHDKFMH